MGRPFEAFDTDPRRQELRFAIKDLLAFIEALSPELREVEVVGEWSVKDVIAHFSAWSQLTIDDILAVLDQRYGDVIWVKEDGFDDFNAKAVQKSRDQNWDTVYDKFIDIIGTLILLYSRLTPAQWALIMYSESDGRDVSIFDCLLIDIKHFRDDHLPELIAAISRLAGES